MADWVLTSRTPGRKPPGTPNAGRRSFRRSGADFLTVADNGKDQSGAEQKYQTRTVLDIEGNQRDIVDAHGRSVMRYDYDMLGNRIHQASMEAGERWMLNDVTGKPIRAWNSRRTTSAPNTMRFAGQHVCPRCTDGGQL